MIHLAVLHRRYLDAILDGRKTVESRLARVRCEPFGCVAPGERLYFKASGGPFLATAIAGEVESFDGLTPRAVAMLRSRFERAVAAEPAYWREKRAAIAATFIELTEIEPVFFGPACPPLHGRAWVRLPARCDVYPACLSEPRRNAVA